MATYSVPQGLLTSFTHDVIDENTGRQDVRWVSADTPSVRIWPGGGQDYVSATSVAWSGDPASGATISVTLNAALTAALGLGTHRATVVVTKDSDASVNDAADFYLRVEPAPTTTSGGDSAPRSYATTQDLRDMARPWAESLQGEYDQLGLANVLAQASRDLDDLIASRYAQNWRGASDGEDDAYTDMKGWLDADGLTTTQPIKRFVVFRTIYYLAGFERTTSEDRESLRMIANRAETEVLRAQRSIVARVTGGGSTHVIPLSGAVRLVR